MIILSLSIAHRVRQRATTDVVSSRLSGPLTRRFCIRRQSVASLKTNTGTRPQRRSHRDRGPLTNPITCERTDTAWHFAPTSIIPARDIAHLERKADINICGKHVPFVVVEGHRRQGVESWLLGIESAQPTEMHSMYSKACATVVWESHCLLDTSRGAE